MTDRTQIGVVRRPGRTLDAGGPLADSLAGLLAAYHLRTEAEKGRPVPGPAALPDRYRAEITDPRTAFADADVLLALTGDTAVGCLVLTAPTAGHREIKRLWTAPAARGRGVATRLLRAALAHADADRSPHPVRLSVWKWRTPAIALYERLGFTVTDSWDPRDDLLCMRRPAPTPTA